MSTPLIISGLRCLSVRPEWADLIASGAKRIENRSWGKHIRGDIALHRCGPSGRILGIMHIADVVPWEPALERFPDQNQYIEGPACWIIDSFTPCIEPVPAVGKLSLWKCPPITVADQPSWRQESR